MKRGLGIGLSALMAVSILAGCGGSAAANGDSGAVSKAEIKTEDVMEVTMTALNGGTNDVFTKAIQREVDKFNGSNEYSVRIKLGCYSNDSYRTELATLMTSNAQPDIFFTWESGFLQPLMDGDKVYPVEDIPVDDEEWYGAYPDKSVFGPLTSGDEIQTVPNSKQIVVVVYSSRLFQDAGARAPITYSEFLETCEALRQARISPLTIPYGEAWYGGRMLQRLCNVLGGEEFYSYTISDEVQWNHETFVEAGTLLKQIVDQGYLVDEFLGMSPSEGFKLFNGGDVVMFICITSGVSKLDVPENPYYNDTDLFPLPSDNPDHSGVNVGSIEQTYAINSQAENPETTATFLKQMTLGDYQRVLTGNAQITATSAQVNLGSLSEMTVQFRKILDQMRVYTPRLDRIYGADESVGFGNASVFTLGDTDPQKAMDNLQQFAINNVNN